MKTIYEHLKNASLAHPDRTAVIEADGETSFGTLFEQAEALRRDLCAQGIGPGTVTGVLARNGSGMIRSMLAVMGTGSAALPVSHQLKPAEMETLMADVRMNYLLRQDDCAAPPAAGDDTALTHGAALHVLNEAPQEDLAELHPAFIRFTSGTTGSSKGVVISHAQLIERLAAARDALKLSELDRILWVLPMAYHFLVTILLYLQEGITLVNCPDLLAKTMLSMANEHQATVLYASPMHIRLLAADKSGTAFEHLRWAISTSSATPPPVMQAFRDRFNIPVTQVYGIIEAGLPMVNLELDDPSLHDTVGQPAPGFTIGLLDKNGNQVMPGQVGRLALKGPGLFDAYLEPFRPVSEVLENGWFDTGDLAEADAEGRIRIRGREKSMINVSGNKAFPEEVEAVIHQYPGIRDCRVYGEPHPLTGEIVCAEIVMASGQELETEKLLKWCRDRLSTYKIPQRVKTAEAIDRTDSGKTKR